MRRPVFLALAATLVLPVLATAASEQVAEGGDIQRFQPAALPFGGLGTPTAEVLLPRTWTVGAHANYARNPLVLRRNGERVGATIENNATLHLHGAVGLTRWFDVGAGLGVVGWQNGTDSRVAALPSTALTDLRILPRFQLFSQVADGFALAVTPVITVPLGGSDALAGDTFLTVVPEVSGSMRGGAGFVAATGSFRVRRATTPLAGVEIGQEVGLRLAGGVPVAERVEVLAELAGALGVGTAAGTSPLEAQLGARWRITDSWAIDGSVGTGLVAAPGTPDLRAVVGFSYGAVTPPALPTCLRSPLDGAPEQLRAAGFDTDADGIDDACDLCPSEAESKNGVTDEDGCPEADRDRDGVRDAIDECIEIPGAAPTGCPDTDGDGLLDRDDQCPKIAGEPLTGCPDGDADGVLDRDDQCPATPGDAPTGCADSDRDGLLDNVDRCPIAAEDVDGFDDTDGCPDLDDDADGIPDATDRCPRVAEDIDGFEDADGCPELDNDRDGVPDADDKCPTEAEVINGIEDTDGCPDQGKTLVVVRAEKIEILDRVYFATNKDVIEKRSYGLLEQVALTIKAHAEIGRIRVEGHTDNVGQPAKNLDLSQRRAASVVRFLVERGVANERLVPRGYGDTKPVVPNVNEKNRATNRRVEFVIVRDGADE